MLTVLKRRKKSALIILTLFFVFSAIPLLLSRVAFQPQTRIISLVADKYGYQPERITVNKGDTIIIRPTSKDVTHGFYLDGYDVEFIIKQEGNAFLKYSWEDDDGIERIDWDKVTEIEFVAEKTGKFVFRCFQICGNLHPFMTGELIVKPNSLYYLMVSLSAWLVISMLIWHGFARATEGPAAPRRINLTRRLPLLERIIKARSFHFLVILPNLIIFYLFILSALWGSPVGNRNIAIIFVWILWWFLLKAVFVPLGARIWCMICPLPAPAEWISRRSITGVRYFEKPLRRLRHRFSGLQRDWPKPLRNMWLQNFIFLFMISFGIILITRPVATAIVFLTILGVSIVLTFFFRQRVFCMYLCPVGGFLGNYSMFSATEIRAIDSDVCKQHKEKSCLIGSPNGWACPWNQYMGKMDRNNHCGFCMECVKSCPKDNIGIFARPLGEDKAIRGYDEMINIMVMMVVAIAFSVTMLGPWKFIKDAANVTETGNIPAFLTYVSGLWAMALVIFPGIFALLCKLGIKLSGTQVIPKPVILKMAYIWIPVGVFTWIAFSLPSVLVNYTYILVVLSDPFGFGWDLLGTANIPFSPFHPEWIPLVQGLLLLTGLYFGISRGFKAIQSFLVTTRSRLIGFFPAVFLAWGVVNGLLKLYLG